MEKRPSHTSIQEVAMPVLQHSHLAMSKESSLKQIKERTKTVSEPHFLTDCDMNFGVLHFHTG